MINANNRERNAALPHGVQGAADSNFACTLRGFARLFPGRRFGGGALSVYLHGKPVVDVWTGYADRHGTEYWTADTGAMVFSATKALASTVIHRLVHRGLLDYDTPVADYWPEFGANGKSDITIRDVMQHRSGRGAVPRFRSLPGTIAQPARARGSGGPPPGPAHCRPSPSGGVAAPAGA